MQWQDADGMNLEIWSVVGLIHPDHDPNLETTRFAVLDREYFAQISLEIYYKYMASSCCLVRPDLTENIS